MAFVPNRYGPVSPLGEITVTTAGTGVPLDTNLSRKQRPETAVSASNPEQYSLSMDDIIVNSAPTNGGGLFIVTNDAQSDTASKSNTDSIVIYIPKGSVPISLAKYLGPLKLQPGSLALDADQDGDKAWIVGIQI